MTFGSIEAASRGVGKGVDAAESADRLGFLQLEAVDGGDVVAQALERAVDRASCQRWVDGWIDEEVDVLGEAIQ
ncbi:MAG TPA: hypothetical protein VFY45_24955 [Baekduia sp.]|nr:hypothetical protein [Baekduia sp.]